MGSISPYQLQTLSCDNVKSCYCQCNCALGINIWLNDGLPMTCYIFAFGGLHCGGGDIHLKDSIQMNE